VAKRPRYVGRKAAASPATGLAKTHNAEQAALVNEALSV
jgi:2-oxoglutarate dehydrogenase E1 component